LGGGLAYKWVDTAMSPPTYDHAHYLARSAFLKTIVASYVTHTIPPSKQPPVTETNELLTVLTYQCPMKTFIYMNTKNFFVKKKRKETKTKTKQTYQSRTKKKRSTMEERQRK